MPAGWTLINHCTSLCPSSLSYKMGRITISTLSKNYVTFAIISVLQRTKAWSGRKDTCSKLHREKVKQGEELYLPSDSTGLRISYYYTPFLLFFLSSDTWNLIKNDPWNFFIFKSLGIKGEKWHKVEPPQSWGSWGTRKQFSPYPSQRTDRELPLDTALELSGMQPPAIRRQKMLIHQSISPNKKLLFSTLAVNFSPLVVTWY